MKNTIPEYDTKCIKYAWNSYRNVEDFDLEYEYNKLRNRLRSRYIWEDYDYETTSKAISGIMYWCQPLLHNVSGVWK